jgi:hypothetical protein
LFCGSYENCRLIDSHKFFAAVLGYPWYPVNNPCKIAAVVLWRFKTPAKWKEYVKKKIKMLKLSL